MKNVFRTRLRWAALGWLSAVCLSGFAQVAQGTLKEVVVTASRFDEERMSAPAAIQVITQEDIKNSGASSVTDVLMMLGGVNVRDITGGQLKLSSSVDLGGFGATATGNTLILIDGRRLNPIDSSEVAWAGVNISSIDRIEIAQGAFGVQYGGGASGGVINIFTKNASADSNQVEMGTGSFGTKFGKANYVKKTGDASISLQVGVAGSDGWRENSGSRSQNLSLRGQKKIDRAKNIYGELFSSEQNSAMSGGVVGKVGEGDLRAAKFNNIGSEQNTKNYGLRLGGFFALTDTSLLDLEFAYEKKASSLTRPYYDTADSIGSFFGFSYTTGAGKSTNSGTGISFSPKIKTDFSNGVSLIYGYEYRKANQDGDGIYGALAQKVFSDNGNTFFKDVQSVQLTNQSTYVLLKTPFISDLNLTLGLRREVQNFDAADANTSSTQSLATSGTFASNAQEISLQKKWTEQSKTYLRLTQSYRFANTDEFWGFDANQNRVFSGALKPQVSKGYEIGYDARNASSQLSVVYGQSVTKDEIRYDPSVFQNANLSDDLSRQQVTIAARHTLRASTIMFGKVMYQKVQFSSGQFSGQTPGLIPDFVLSLGLTQQFDARTWSGLYLNHVSRQNYDASADIMAKINQMPSFNALDAFLSRSYGNIDSKFTIKNVLGGVNASSGGYGFVSAPGATGASNYYYYPSDPRSFHLSVNYKY
jgi:iron complex outermembrane receptor protein